MVLKSDFATDPKKKPLCNGANFCIDIAFYYSVPVIAFILGTPLIILLTKFMQRKLLIFFSFLLMAAFILVLGPSHLIHYDSQG